jgi:hypothetical protein
MFMSDIAMMAYGMNAECFHRIHSFQHRTAEMLVCVGVKHSK